MYECVREVGGKELPNPASGFSVGSRLGKHQTPASDPEALRTPIQFLIPDPRELGIEKIEIGP